MVNCCLGCKPSKQQPVFSRRKLMFLDMFSKAHEVYKAWVD